MIFKIGVAIAKKWNCIANAQNTRFKQIVSYRNLWSIGLVKCPTNRIKTYLQNNEWWQVCPVSTDTFVYTKDSSDYRAWWIQATTTRENLKDIGASLYHTLRTALI